MERREHDIMMDMLANLHMSFDNLVTVGLTSQNTSLQDKEVYENNDWVREKFKDLYGEFDKISFDAFYNNAKVYYNALGTADYNESMKKQVTFHRDNIFVPIEKRRSGPDFIEFHSLNPYLITSSVIELGREGPRTKSEDELAQSNKVLLNPTTAGTNLENALWGDSPNDNFWGYFTDTLVLAQYDTAGTHIDPFTGQEVTHEAGLLKTDDSGNFYYETLDGRDVYGKRILNKMNVLTTDGSEWNKYDFFDSDDLNLKSIGGTVLKNLALVGTMFIPYVGPWITGLSMATQMAGLFGTLGKMTMGSDSPTFSALEGWSKSMNRQTAKSEYAQQNTWCWENFINLIGDVAGLLREQRFIFEKIPAIFKGTNIMTKEGQAAKLAEFTKLLSKLTETTIANLKKAKINNADLLKATSELKAGEALKAQALLDSFIKGYNNLGSILSKGYMTAITVGDTYGEAKLAGASDLDATLLTLGYAAGEYAILSTGLGEWIMPELRAGRYKALAIAKAITKLDEQTESLYKLFGKQLTNIPKEGKKQYVKNLFNIGKNIARAEYSNGTRSAIATLASGAGEGFEEVSEEFLADFSKGCYDVVKWLLGEDTRINTFGYNFDKGSWNGSELIDRYGMSLVGGFFGGGLTNLATNYKMVNSFNNMTKEQAILELVYMGRNGKLDEFLKEAEKMNLGDASKSTNFEILGNNIVFSPGTKEDNQDLAIKQVLKNNVKIIKEILQSNGAVSDSQFLDKQTLGDLRFNALHKSSTAGLYLLEYNRLNAKLVKLVSDINSKIASVLDENKDGVTTDRESRKAKLSTEDQSAIKILELELDDTKKQLDKLTSGESAYDFIATSLFELTSALSGRFTTTTFPLYAETKYNKKYSELTEGEKASALTEYKNWKNTEGKELILLLSRIYRNIAELSSSVIKNHELTYLSIPSELLKMNEVISRLYTDVLGYHLPIIQDEELYLQLALEASNESILNVSTKLVQLLGSELDVSELKNILERIKNINPQLSTEEKQKLSASIIKEYNQKLDDILLNNITKLVLPYLDRGFINSETKNHLTSILKNLHLKSINAVSSWEIWAEENLSLIEQLTALNPYINISQSILNTLQTIDSLNSTPLEQNLNEFSISIGTDPINLTQLIERLNKSFNETSNNITKFNIDDLLYKDLTNAIYTLELYQASIQGARTDNAGLNNLFGFNATLNEVASKIEGSKQNKLAEIDKTVADVFDADILANLNKLRFLKQLFELNLGQKLTKLDRVATKKDLLIYKRLKYIVSIPNEHPLKNWEGFLALQTAINSMKLHAEMLSRNETVLNEDLKEEFEKEKLSAENAIYDFFLIESNKLKLNDPTKLIEFIDPSRLLLYTESKELLTEGLENVDDNSIVWWIASRAALKAEDFYHQYHLIIDLKSENPLAPIATLELAIYNNYASIVNGNVFSAFHKAMRYALINDWKNKKPEERLSILKSLNKAEILADEKFAKYAINFLPTPRYSNIILTEGIPGSGKTVGVFQPTIELLRKFHSDVLKNVMIMHGANPNSAIDLLTNLKLTKDNSKAYGRRLGMKEINPNWREYPKNEQDYSYQVPESDYTITEDEHEIVSSLGVKDTSNSPSLIIIDEISKFTAYDLDLINKYALKYGITVLVAGDFDQSGVEGSHTIPSVKEFEELTWRISLNRNNFMHTFKLGVSMRTDNMLKTTNLLRLLTYMQNPNSNEIINFNYFQDETGLYGDKVLGYDSDTDNSSTLVASVIQEVKNMINTLKEGKNGKKQKIGYIYNNKTSPIYAELSKDEYKEYIDLREGGTALGLEAQYYIIEADATTETIDTYLRDIYTGISRAQLGSILIAPLNYKGVKFSHTLVSEKINEPLGKNTILTFAKKRKELLEKITKDGKVSNIIPRNKLSVSTSNNPKLSVSSNTSTLTLNPGISPNPSVPTIAEQKVKLLLDIENAKDIATLDLLLNNAPEELKNDEDVLNTYIRIADSLVPPPPPIETPDTETVSKTISTTEDGSSTELPNISKLDHADLVQEYGEKLNINSFTININGTTIPIFLEQIPFITRNMSDMLLYSGNSNIINSNDRNIVVVNIGGFKLPFYMSSGQGGKKSVLSGLWYPFFGFAPSGWLNKGTEEQINNFYESPVLKAIAERLNELIGTNLLDLRIGPACPLEFREGIENPCFEFINTDMLPTENSTASTIENLKINVENAINNINQKVEEFQSEIKPTESEALPLIYEEDHSNITDTDIIPDSIYQELLDESSKTETLALSTFDSNIKQIEMLLHSFNTFEVGVLTDTNGYPTAIGSLDWMDARIDSINGLIKIDKALGHPIKTVKDYVKIIGDIRSIIFNTVDKSKIELEIQNILGLSGIYCTFAFKSTPLNKNSNGREFVSSTPNPLEKGRNEKTLFNGSTDSRSNEFHNKSIVAIIGDPHTGNLLELPLLGLSSPFTLMQIKDNNGLLIFAPVYNRFLQLLKEINSLHQISETLVSEFDGLPQFLELINLFKLFNLTDAAIFYIDDKTWTPAKNLQCVGPQFVTEKGYYQLTSGLLMNENTNPESLWIELVDFAEYNNRNRVSIADTQRVMTSKVMVSISGEVDDVDHKIANPSHPFILVSYNKALNNDLKIIDQYIKQEKDPSIKKEVKLVYVLPPKASIREYLSNLHKILTIPKGVTAKLHGIQYIGTLTTSYKLLSVLMSDENFVNRLEEKMPGAVELVLNALDKLDSYKGNIDEKELQRDLLYESFDWSSIGLSKQKLAGLFDAILANIAYNRKTLGEEKSFNPSENDIQLIESILSKASINGIYHKVVVTTNDQNIGPFVIPNLGRDYTYLGRPFKIHGKLDSYTFKGNMNFLINSIFSKLQYNGKHYYSIDNSSYMLKDQNGKFLIGNSNLSRKNLRSTLDIINKRRINNIIEYVKNKLGIDVTSYFQNNTIQEAQQKIVLKINSENHLVISFIIDNNIIISDKSNYFDGQIYIYDNNNNPITNISNLSDNNGNYTFTISTIIDGKLITMEAIYNKSTNDMDLIIPPNDVIIPQPILHVSSDNFDEYISTANELLESVFDMDPLLEDVFTATTYEEFIRNFFDLDYLLEDLRIELLQEVLSDNLNELQNNIIADIIDIESYNKNILEQNNTCSLTIKIKF